MTDVLSAEKLDGIRSDVTDSMAMFTKDFISTFQNLRIKAMMEEKGDSGEPEDDHQLLSRPHTDTTDDSPLFTGGLVKRGQVRKNWKDRFFVVRADHVIEYYESESKFKSGGSPKGTINLSGYTIVSDPNARKKHEKDELAKMFGGSGTDDYSKYDPFTIECYHRVKRRWLLKCDSEEQFKQWVNICELCARNVRSGALNDPLKKQAFEKASLKLKSHLSVPEMFGTEVDILTGMITESTWNSRVGGDSAFKNIPGPAAMKTKAATKGYETVYKIVEGIVTASWKTTLVAVEQSESKIEAGFSSLKNSACEVESKTSDKIKTTIAPVVDPITEKAVNPLATNLAKYLIKETEEPITSVEPVLEVKTEEYTRERASGKEATLCNIKRDENSMNGSNGSFQRLEAILTAANLLDIVPNGVMSVFDKAKQVIDKLQFADFVIEVREGTFENTERAAYTYEATLDESTGGDLTQATDKREQVFAQVKEKYRHDSVMDRNLAVVNFIVRLLNMIGGDYIREKCSSLVAPLDSLIPDPLKEFITIEGILDSVISSCFENAASKAVEAASKK
eukprot:gene3724-8358_t